MAKKNKIDNNDKSYPISDSPFFNLKSKSKLSNILKDDLSLLKKLSSDSFYETFEISGKNGKSRTIEKPLPSLDRIHTRIASLLSRIVTPHYLHSGKKKHSNITNAASHKENPFILTMDIQKFFPSTTEKHVFNFFYITMRCSPDVSGLLAKLITFNGHVPTGSRISLIIAYWANHKMFHELNILAKDHKLQMTVYVDDLTFSGCYISRKIPWLVKKLVKKHGLSIHPRKTCLFKEKDVKIVTGVVIKKGDLLIKNEQHFKTYQDIEAWKISKSTGYIPESLQARLQGRLLAMSSIDPRYKDKYRSIRRASNN